MWPWSAKNRKEYLSLYSFNPKTRAYVIEISLDDYSELFNGWDASPLKRKELEPELLDYFEGAALEIPLREKVEICLHLPGGLRDAEKEAKSATAILQNMRVQLLLTDRKLGEIYRKAATYAVISLLLLAVAYAWPGRAGLQLFTKLITEGVFIGGWWFLYEAFSMLFFVGHDVRRERSVFLRYLDSPIYFREISE
ncbi:MAG TPA: hypothetical protein DCM14_08725 [Clostridiales bacterium UBA8153]|nr:hypothetical protein [Clostridiales bacterium UBA8153]